MWKKYFCGTRGLDVCDLWFLYFIFKGISFFPYRIIHFKVPAVWNQSQQLTSKKPEHSTIRLRLTLVKIN